MLTACTHTEAPDCDWDAIVLQSPAATIFQSAAWGRYLVACGHRVVPFVVEDEGGVSVASLLAYVEHVPPEAMTSRIKGIAASTFRRLLPVLRWHHGPVVLDTSRHAEAIATISEAVNSWCMDQGIYQVKSASLAEHDMASPQGRQHWATAGFGLSSWGTYVVDLAGDEAGLHKAMKRDARYSINRATKQGIVVSRATTLDEIHDYEALLKDTRRHLGLGMPPNYPNKRMWQHLSPSGHVELLLAYHDEQLIAGLGALVFNGVVYEIAPARDMGNDLSSRAGDLLKWALMRWGLSTGQRHYDLAGVSPNPGSPKEQNIRQYKAKFGGRFVEYPVINKTYATRGGRLIRVLEGVAGV